MIQYSLLVLFSLTYVFSGQVQNGISPEKLVIAAHQEKTGIHLYEKEALFAMVSPKDVQKFRANGLVRYSEFGAKGNGKTDDIDAIAAAHAFANQHGLFVKADEGATYYIGGKERTAFIQTDTDFGTATFIIDDTEVQNRNAPIFEVSTSLLPY